MAVKYRIACFLEDAAQDSLIPALFSRILRERKLPEEQYHIYTLYNRGGASLRAYTDYLLETKRDPSKKVDLLIVGSDANCKGVTKRREWITSQTYGLDLAPDIIPAVPDPHIERWYLLDLPALSKVSGVELSGGLPTLKCNKDVYKNLLKEVFLSSGIEPPLGGAEYGKLLADHMDLYSSGKKEHSFAEYISAVGDWLKIHP